jgi:cytochrome c553
MAEATATTAAAAMAEATATTAAAVYGCPRCHKAAKKGARRSERLFIPFMIGTAGTGAP